MTTVSQFQEKIVNYEDFLIKLPTKILLYGISSSGKSSLFLDMVADENRDYLFDKKLTTIYYSIPIGTTYQRSPFLKQFKERCSIVKFIEGIPKLSEILHNIYANVFPISCKPFIDKISII